MQTKIMNEGWATYWHSKLMTTRVLDASEIIEYADNAAGVLATSKGQLNPYKLGVELYRHNEELMGPRAVRQRVGKTATISTPRRTGTSASGSGSNGNGSSRCASLYNDVTFIDEFL